MLKKLYYFSDMLSARLFNKLRYVPLMVLPFLAWLLPINSGVGTGEISSQKINLALRRTADELLRESGDSSSRIPVVEEVGGNVWRLRLNQPFHYEALPALLQSALDLHGISQPYEATVRGCEDAVINLGYHQTDFLKKGTVACQNREMPEGCQYIEIVFLDTVIKKPVWAIKGGIFITLILGLTGFWFFSRRKSLPSENIGDTEIEWMDFGNSRLDVSGQILLCGGGREKLTFRETKLLKLFASNPDKLLEREFILQQVWADEGVLVGRSVDVFVSRLRKKIAKDSTLAIMAVHGVGYRMEVKGKGVRCKVLGVSSKA